MIYRFMVFGLVFGVLSGCGNERTGSEVDANVRDASAVLDSGAMDAGTQESDGGEDSSVADGGEDGSVADGGQADANVEDDANVEGPIACALNSDCAPELRCECNEEVGCFCLPGARGTGQNGVDTCTGSNDCASALCLEGPASSDAFYCSDECETDEDCLPNLPICRDIFFVGRVCTRAPDA